MKSTKLARSTKNERKQSNNKESKQKVRYGVIGLGYISQIATLPAFAHAKNCSLEALISGNKEKLETLGKQYNVANLFQYAQLDECLNQGIIDALYIALPNAMHMDCTIRAAKAGIHVLCEKPMATSIDDCRRMIEECQDNNVKLMIAYRLHFERTNLEVIEMIKSGKLGEPVLFNSTFSMQVASDGIRTNGKLGGGALFDIGIYCVNAARNIFNAEPQRVFGMVSNPRDERFKNVDGLTTGVLEFDKGRVASFVSSFGAADCGAYEVVGTKGSIRVSPAYDFENGISYEVTIDEKKESHEGKKSDQFAPELAHFADCILNDAEPEPSGEEGLADIRVIEALYNSAERRNSVRLTEYEKRSQPTRELEAHYPPIKPPKLIQAQMPSQQ